MLHALSSGSIKVKVKVKVGALIDLLVTREAARVLPKVVAEHLFKFELKVKS